MEKNKKLYIILATLVVVLIASFMLFSDMFKNQQAVSSKQIVKEDIKEEESDTEKTDINLEDVDSETDDEPMHDHYTETEDSIFEEESSESYEVSNIEFSQPQLLSGFYEEEYSIMLDGVGNNGETVVFQSSGYEELITYEIGSKDRKVIEQFTGYRYIDPETDQIIYTMRDDVLEKYGDKTIVAFSRSDGRKTGLGNLEGPNDIIQSVIHEGMLFYTYGGFFIPEGLNVIELPGDQNSVLFEDISNVLQSGTFTGVASDGERLIFSSSSDRTISELTTGKENVLVDISDEYNDVRVLDVEGDTIAYALGKDGYISEIRNNVTDDIIEVYVFEDLHLLDENHFVYIDNETLYVHNIKDNETEVLGNAVMNLTVSGNKVFYLSNQEIYYIEYEIS